ncbi:MAG: hypothetical protein JSR99_18885 [Proteobacteria bacterium]|nr:hypothetical protein [Pseudomonadota bacterium]
MTEKNPILRLKEWYELTIADWPWVRAATITAPVAGAAFYLNTNLPAQLQVDLSKANIYVLFVAAIFAIYLLLVAAFFNSKLIAERQLRAAEEGFRYDHRGTLFNGTQPNIAFRVVTFQGLLSGLAEAMDGQTARNALFDTGARASVDFAKKLPQIYDENVRRLRGGNRWVELSFPEKLWKWTEYDSSTGWGILAAATDNQQVTVTVTHYSGLFKRPSYFAWFLAGYCTTVIQTILTSEKGNGYRGLRHARCVSIDDQSEDTVRFYYELS